MNEGIHTIYLHGMPGGPEELALFGGGAFDESQVFAPDRGVLAPGADFGGAVDELQRQVEARFPAGPVRIVGFSLGARMALELAARLGERVAQVDLISAAAPLACGADLSDMAGGALFGMARDAPGRFGLVTSLQGMIARVAPGLLTRAIFAGVQGDDRALAADPHFRRVMRGILRGSLVGGSGGYRREMLAYVRPWEALVPRVTAPVTLWHGTRDNWAPPMMAQWLATHLPNVAAVHMLEGKSHYSALADVLERAPIAFTRRPSTEAG